MASPKPKLQPTGGHSVSVDSAMMVDHPVCSFLGAPLHQRVREPRECFEENY